ncbi:MAG: PAS domain S-box protein [Gammaproteobacteria bacterium]
MKKRIRLGERIAQTNPVLITVCGLVLAILLRAILTPLWAHNYPFITFYPAIMLSSIVGGVKHGLFATAVSALLVFIFFFDAPHLSIEQGVALALFFVANLAMIATAEIVARARRQAFAETTAALKREEAASIALEARERLNKALHISRLKAIKLMEEAIQARQKAEQLHNKLRNSEEGMQEALRVSRSFTFEWDLASDRMSRSASCGEILDLSNRDLSENFGTHYYRHVSVEDQIRLKTLQDELQPGKDRYSIKYRFLRADGGIAVLEENARGFFGRSGTLTRLIGVCTDVTAREKAEEERQKFVSLADSSQEFIGMYDLDFNPFYINAAGMEMTGVANLEAAHKSNVEDFFFPEDRAFISKEFFPRALRDGSAEIEIRFRHFQSSQAIWMLYNIFAIRDSNGTITAWAIVGRNIDARKRAEAALRQATERARFLAEVIDNADIAFRAGTADGRLIMCNRAFAELTGYSREELLQKEFNAHAMLTPPEWHAADTSQLALALRTRQPVRYEQEYLRKDGTRVPVELFIQPIFDDADNLLHYRAFVTDISERKQAEAALQKAHNELETRVRERTAELRHMMELMQTERQRFKDVLDQLPAYLVLISPDHRISFANRFFCERFGTDNGQCSPEYLFNLDSSGKRCETFKVLEENAPQHWEWIGRDLRIYDIYDFPFTDVDGSPLIMEIGLDITERRAAEAELEKHRLHLEDLVQERTAQLETTNTQLQNEIIERKSAEEALRDANRRKDEFLATLAHELRNPLAPLRNALEIMHHRDPSDPALNKLHNMMERQVALLARLVDDLLEVSRITRGKIELRMAATPLASVVNDAVDTSRPFIDAGRHRLSVKLPQTPLILYIDAARITQVLANLLINAAKFTPGGGQIELTAAPAQGPNGATSLTLCVRDNGIGVSAEMRERIFEMFAQAAKPASGLGIGLTLVRKLVELHGGNIAVHSAGTGHGSEFRIQLPPACLMSTQTTAETCPVPNSPISAGRRILVVDDNHDAADSLAALLEILGWEVRQAYSGPEGLEQVAAWRPELVFLDIGMDGMDGCEVARRIRAEPGNTGIKLIALTGWGQENVRQETRAAGFSHHLVKPVDFALLEEVLDGRYKTDEKPVLTQTGVQERACVSAAGSRSIAGSGKRT